MVLTTGCSPGAGQLMSSVVWPGSCWIRTTQHIILLDEGSSCSALGLLLHAVASLAANLCCLESMISGVGASPNSIINAPLGVVGSAPRMDLACQLRRCWRSSRLPTSLRSHQSSLQYRATAGMQATWTALTLSGTTPYILVRVWSLASAAMDFSMHRLSYTLNIRCASIQTPSQCVACSMNCMNPFQTFIFAVSFGRRCLLWPHLRSHSTVSIFAVLNFRPRLLALLMLFAAHIPSIVTT